MGQNSGTRRPVGRRRGAAAFATASLAFALPSCGLLGGGQQPQAVTRTIVTTSSPTPSETPAVTPTSPDDLFVQVGDGVVRIGVVGCDGWSVGSGLLVSPTTVLTVSHVVASGAWFSVRAGHSVVSAEVVADAPERELALLRLSEPLDGHVFEFAEAEPEVGAPVFALGYPGGKPLSQTGGTVSGLDRRREVADQDLEHLVQFDAAIAGGNSGGPVVDASGQVIGLSEAVEQEEQNTNYAVSGRDAAGFVADNADAQDVVDVAHCPAPRAEVEQLVRVDSQAGDAWDVAYWLATDYRSINDGDYEYAWNLMTRHMRGSYDGLDAFADAESTSVVLDAHLLDVEAVDEVTDRAKVRFVSLQDEDHAPRGTRQTCSVWSITYDLRMDAGIWQIDRSRLTSGGPTVCTSGQRRQYEAQRDAMLGQGG